MYCIDVNSEYHLESWHSGMSVKFVSDRPLKSVNPEEGKLYYNPFPTNIDNTIIGEYRKGKLQSALGRYSYPFLEEVDDVHIKIFNSDGKQTGRELIEKYMGSVFPIVDITDHEKYKYIIEIEGTRVALSSENSIFIKSDWTKPNPKEMIDNHVIYRGIKVHILDRSSAFGLYSYRAIDIRTGYYFTIMEREFAEILKLEKVVLSNDQEKELRKIVNLSQTTQSIITNEITSYTGVFGIRYYLPKKHDWEADYPTFLVKEEDLETINDKLSDRYYYCERRKCFFPKKEYIKILENKKQSNRGRPRFNINSLNSARLRNS